MRRFSPHADRFAGGLTLCRMSPVIPFRRRSSAPIALWAVAATVLAFSATYIFLGWQETRDATKSHQVQIIQPTPLQTGPIEVIDGDTVRLEGVAYRLVGF